MHDVHSREVAATINARDLLQRRRTTPIPIEHVRLAVARLHAVRRKLGIQPYFDEQFLSPGELKNRDAYELAVARQLIAAGRFVCALPSTTTVRWQVSPDFIVDSTAVDVKRVTGKGVTRRIRRGIEQTGGRGGALVLQVTDPHLIPTARLAIQRAVAQGQLAYVLLEASDGTAVESFGAWGEANE